VLRSSRACRSPNHPTIITAEALKSKLPNFSVAEQTLDLPAERGGGREAARLLPWLLAAWARAEPVVRLAARLPRTGDRAEAGLLLRAAARANPRASCSRIATSCELARRFRRSRFAGDVLAARLPAGVSQLRIYRHVWYPMLRAAKW